MDISQLDAIAGRPVDRANARSLLAGLAQYPAGIDRPHRMAHFLAQIMHESGGFAFDREIATGEAYEGRADLGNTRPGDGRRFKGRTAVQVTGRANYAAFRDWCRSIGLDAPDFAVMPEAILTDPWEGLAPIWYWVTHGLNSLADAGDLGGITKRINGGYNGLADRKRLYARAALVLLGFAAGDTSGFQRAAGLAADGVAGPKTMAALHAALLKRSAPVAAKPVTPRHPPMVPPAVEIPERPGFWAALIAMLRR